MKQILSEEKMREQAITQAVCAGCVGVYDAEALAEGVCAHCWAEARRIRMHTGASYRLQGRALDFCLTRGFTSTRRVTPLVWDIQRLLEDVAEDAINQMAYTDYFGDRPALYLKRGEEYLPIAPLNHYPAPGVWLVEWDEKSRSTRSLSRLPAGRRMPAAADREQANAALAAVQALPYPKTLGDVVRAVLNVVGNTQKEP